MFKYNIDNYKHKYYDLLRDNFEHILAKYQKIVFFDLYFDYEPFIDDRLASLLKKKDTRIYFVDPMEEIDFQFKHWDVFKRIISFERKDKYIYAELHNINVEFFPLGTRYYLYNDNEGISYWCEWSAVTGYLGGRLN